MAGGKIKTSNSTETGSDIESSFTERNSLGLLLTATSLIGRFNKEIDNRKSDVTNDIHHFIRNCERAQSICNHSAIFHIICSRIEGSASELIQNQENWCKLKKFLLEQYSKGIKRRKGAKSRNPKNIEDAKKFAQEEENELITDRQNNRQVNQIQWVHCNICNGNDHVAKYFYKRQNEKFNFSNKENFAGRAQNREFQNHSGHKSYRYNRKRNLNRDGNFSGERKFDMQNYNELEPKALATGGTRD
ncbi:hypothetical protein FQA39_LY06213 [Lamprigera yunnana]|nr:hypothetical protein FQA39_LY06213 [Lamprigera yunnana]